MSHKVHKKENDKIKWGSVAKITGIFLGSFTIGSLIGGFLGIKTAKAPGYYDISSNFSPEGFFRKRPKEFAVLTQAVERIYPEDKHGPGAIQLGVPDFINKQLMTAWGGNSKDYRKPPFVNNNPDVGQSPLTIREIFIRGLRKMDEKSFELFQVSFHQASEEAQMEILSKLEADEVELQGVRATSFFALLRQTTLEGVYADPLYGGNQNMEGWKMKEYPGAKYSYKELVENPHFVPLSPVDVTTHQQVFMDKESR